MNRINSKLPVIPLYYSIPLLAVCIVILAILIGVFRLDVGEVLFAPPNAVSVSACGTLSANDTYYVLTTSLNFNGANCFTIIGNNVVLDGESKHVVANLVGGSGSGVVAYGNNVTLTGLNITNVTEGIIVRGNNSNITRSFIASASVFGIHIFQSSGASITSNTILYAPVVGLYIDASDYNTIVGNTIIGAQLIGGSSGGGIGLLDSDSTTALDNTILYTQVPVGLANSNGNSFTRTFTAFATLNSLYILNSTGTRNSFFHNRFVNSSESSIVLDTVTDALFVNQSVRNTSAAFYDFAVSPTGASFELVDSAFANYSFGGGALPRFKSTGNSIINYTQPVNGAGTNLSADVRLGFNYVDVNSALRPGLNKPATITFEGLSTNFVNPVIYRNGQACPTSICTALTSLNAGTVIITVTGWTNYSIGSSTPPAPTLSISEPDDDDVYSTTSFPVTFIVDLSQNGSAWFSLNNGSTNTTMNSSDNQHFTYAQGLLSAGNYTFNAYANFTGSSVTATDFANFRVTNTSGGTTGGTTGTSTGTGTGTGTTAGTTGGTGQNVTPPNTTVVLNNSGSGAGGGTTSFELKYVVYWLLIAVLCIVIVILILLIVKHFRSRTEQRQRIPGSIVSQLR